ncbi:unnamed protein product [Blepharisma stoltei]|uniref:EF-hand domain-containing protein n=1 Tax=Blepharisma stoltei TaxID=1481888 RepID=A0AAU9J2R0_9CILI|nr:unnamed protein product [Blepharisma stoltei]
MANYPSPIKTINNLPSSPSYDETIHSTFNLTSTIYDNYDKLPVINPSPKTTKNAPRILRQSLEVAPKHQIPNLDFIKKQNKLKLNASHHMIRAMVSVEDEKEAIKDKSAFSKSFKRMSAGMKIIIGIKAKKQNLLNQVTENLQPVFEKSKAVNSFPNNSDRKWNENNRDAWIKKHGLEAINNDSKDFAEFLKQLFEALDHENIGFINLTDVIAALLALGISRDISYIEKALMIIFKTNNLSTMKIEKQQFLEMFKGDKKTDFLLNALNLYCKEVVRDEENKAFSQSSSSFDSSMMKEGPKTFRIDQFAVLLKLWWKELEPDHDLVHINKVCEFLVDKNLVSNKLEGRILINKYVNSKHLSYEKFEKLFLKPMFKGGLINLVSSFNLTENNLPLRLKLGQEQRKVLISGTKPSLNSSVKHGRMVLDSLDKYKQKNGNIDKDFSISLEEAEELNEDRLQSYLYSIRDDARFFLNERGELISNSKNTWDIREQVKPENDNSILNSSQKYKKSTYMSILENKTVEEAKKTASLSPKVKLFRENYLWKRYNNLINRFPSH